MTQFKHSTGLLLIKLLRFKFLKNQLFSFCCFVDCQASKYERALLKKLFHSNYDKNERPVVNDTDAVVVVFGLTLNQIVDVVRILNHVSVLRPTLEGIISTI